MKGLRLTLPQARAVLVAAQGLDARPGQPATQEAVLGCIRRMGALQIDTIHVVARSPFLVLFSRLGPYEPAWLEALLRERRLFEYWSHEACFLPIEDFPLYRHRMLDLRGMAWKYAHALMEKRRDEVEALLGRIRAEGPVRSSDFTRTDGKSGGWWEWKPEKRMLESLFTAGELMIARRERFQRVYDLRERVLPDWSDAALPPREEAERTLALKAVRALGVTSARWVAD
ncbi:MAG: winged helix-turn-helix domain-containing protein, partial [Myxococcales bacterium]